MVQAMASPPIIADPAQASRRARIRVVVAITLLATAIGILAFLNRQKPAQDELPAETAPVAQESISSQEAEPAVAPEPPVAPTPPVAETPPDQVVAENTDLQPPPPPPVPGVLPKPADAGVKVVNKSSTLPEETGAGMKTAAPTANRPEKTNAPVSAPAVQAPPASPTASLAKTITPKGFEVQLGVFSDMENAKQLQAKLAENGIPSHTETRVQIGPFKTRAEADQAKEKLKTLGISSVITPR